MTVEDFVVPAPNHCSQVCHKIQQPMEVISQRNFEDVRYYGKQGILQFFTASAVETYIELEL
jgi:hypothetical protein